MALSRFEDIESWQEARLLVGNVYGYLKDCRDYGFRDQIQRASVSIMSNIAEGFERGGNKEFLHFLTIARGSLAEVKSLGYAGMDIGLLNAEQFSMIERRTARLKGLLNGFISYLKQPKAQG